MNLFFKINSILIKKKNFLGNISIFFFLILVSFGIKFYFPNKISSYYFMIILAFCILIFFSLIKKKKIALFLFIIIFLGGSHKEIQKKYFSFMSLMHWNDGLKIYMSVPYNFYNKNYSKGLRQFYLTDNGGNSDLNYIEGFFYLLKIHNVKKYRVSNFFQNEINESVLFKERLKEITYPSKLVIKNFKKTINESSENNHYFRLQNNTENIPYNCKFLDQKRFVRILKCK